MFHEILKRGVRLVCLEALPGKHTHFHVNGFVSSSKVLAEHRLSGVRRACDDQATPSPSSQKRHKPARHQVKGCLLDWRNSRIRLLAIELVGQANLGNASRNRAIQRKGSCRPTRPQYFCQGIGKHALPSCPESRQFLANLARTAPKENNNSLSAREFGGLRAKHIARTTSISSACIDHKNRCARTRGIQGGDDFVGGYCRVMIRPASVAAHEIISSLEGISVSSEEQHRGVIGLEVTFAERRQCGSDGLVLESCRWCAWYFESLE